MRTWREILGAPPDVRPGLPETGDKSDKTFNERSFVTNVTGFGGIEKQHEPAFVTIVTTVGGVQSDKVTPFQRSFFPQLVGIWATTRLDLLELARQQGIPPECAETFWRYRQRSKAGSPA